MNSKLSPLSVFHKEKHEDFENHLYKKTLKI